MATLVPTVVDTAGVGGGVDYDSLSAAEADTFNATNTNLVTGDEYCVCTLKATEGDADATAVTIDCFTGTDSTHYLSLVVDSGSRHAGVWSTSKYRLHVSAATALTISDGDITLDGLQIGVTCATDWTTRYCISIGVAAPVIVKNCYLYGDDNVSGRRLRLIYSGVSGTANVKVWNTAFYHTGTGGDAGYGNGLYSGSTGGTEYLINCSFKNCKTGINRVSTSTTYIYNCLFDSCTADAAGTVTDLNNATTNDNSKGLDDASNTYSITAGKFTAATDFHITSDSGAVDHADSSLASSLFADDIDGSTRTGTWDCGADEYVAAGNPWYAYAQQ